MSLEKLQGYRILDLDDAPVFIFYGPTGSGKTYLACSASKVLGLAPVAFIPLRKTDQTLVGKVDIDTKKIVILDPSSVPNMANRWEAIKRVTRSVRDAKPFPFGAVILDDVHLGQYYAEEKARSVSPFHNGDSPLLELTQQGDYRLAGQWLIPVVLELVATCKVNKVPLIMTCQERLLRTVPEGESDADAAISYKTTLGLMPSIIQVIAGVSDIIGKMRMSGSETVVEFRRGPYRDAKDETGLLGDSNKKLTMAQIVNKLAEGGWEWAKKVKVERVVSQV